MKVLLNLVGVLTDFIVVGRVGLPYKRATLPAFPQQALRLESISLRKNLPAPIERFRHLDCSQQALVLTSVVLIESQSIPPLRADL